MNTKDRGNITESRFVFEFIKLGYNVLIPFGDNCRYDMVVEKNNKFYRIQCKTGRIKNNCILFDTCSSQSHRNNGKQSYEGQVDYFAVYSHEIDKCYIIPISETNKTRNQLRLEPPKNNQKTKIKWAYDYRIEFLPLA